MSEDRTPIEELVKADLIGRGFNEETILNNRGLIGAVTEFMREKYKHTKEDVIKAHVNGSETCLQWEQGQSMKDKAEQYYNETHNK